MLTGRKSSSMKPCAKCGGTDRYKSGQCKTCQKRRMAARRGGETEANSGASFGPPGAAQRGRPQPSMQFDINFNVDLGENDGDEDDFLMALDSAPNRLRYMMRRHKRTLSGFDQEHHIMNQILGSMASLGGTMADVKFFVQRRHELLGKRADYDLKMSRELQVFGELAAKEESETPVEIYFTAPDPEAMIQPSIGDSMNMDALLPKAAGDA